jgi:hypothetical protein
MTRHFPKASYTERLKALTNEAIAEGKNPPAYWQWLLEHDPKYAKQT